MVQKGLNIISMCRICFEVHQCYNSYGISNLSSIKKYLSEALGVLRNYLIGSSSACW